MIKQDEESTSHFLQRWVSAGDVLVMISSLVMIGIAFGTLATRVDSVADDVTYLKNREITPGAERRIAVLEAQVVQQRVDAQERWREVRDQLDRIELKVDQHMSGSRPR